MNIPLEERLDRLTQWFYRKNDRPLLGFYLDSQYPLHRFHGAATLHTGKVSAQDIIVEDYLDDCDRLYGLYESAGGDLIWSAAPFFGMPWVEAAMGCDVIADKKTGSTHSLPPADFLETLSFNPFSDNNPWVRKMLGFLPAMQQRSAGRYPVGVTLMRGISDLLSALYGGENLIYRMMEAPEEVMAVADRVTDFYIGFGKCMMDNIPLFHGGTGSFFYSMWSPGKTIWMQEDASALLSPGLYEEFIHPFYCRVVDAFEHSIVHLHPSKYIPADFIIKTKTNAIELHIDHGGPTAEKLFDVHKKIIEEKPLLIWGDLDMADLNFVLKNLPHRGLAINMVVSSPKEAKDMWDHASSIWKK